MSFLLITWCEDIVLHFSHTIASILRLELVKQLTAAQLYINIIINGAYEPCSESYIYHLVIIDFT